MRVCSIKTEQRILEIDDRLYMIRRYGKMNDYPQKLMELMAASGTGTGCLRLYSKFVKGKGFKDTNIAKIELSKKFTVTNLKDKWADELGKFYGFAAWVNRNAMFQITEIKFLPFEYCRLAIDENRNLTGQIAVHPDWGQRRLYPRALRVDDVKYIDGFTDDPEEIVKQVNKAGGWSKWLGQVYWFSMEGSTEYPRALYDSVISDLSTENSVSTVKNRGAKNNFLPAGMIVTKGKEPEDGKDNMVDTEAGEAIKQLQGDENSFNILEVTVEYDEEVPQFVPFQVQNRDKLYEITEKTCQQNIGNIFNQPPIIRGQHTVQAGKLPTSVEIRDAFDYYNSIIFTDRNVISENLAAITKTFIKPINSDFEIDPVEFISTESKLVKEQNNVNQQG